ncbi:MAG: hypothetical protein ACK47B_15660 [Armatimonadota bacterium]
MRCRVGLLLPLCLAGALLGLAADRGNAGAGLSGQSVLLSAASEPGLRKRVSLNAEGAHVEQVLTQLQAVSGVRLEAQGRVKDERVVALVADETVGEVLDSIASLYRAGWVRQQSGSRVVYRLEERPNLERDEDRLRRQCLERAMARLRAGLSNGPARPVDPRRDWSKCYELVLPAISSRAGELLQSGYLELAPGELPEPARSGLLAALQPRLDYEHAAFVGIQETFDADRQPGAAGLVVPEAKAPPAAAVDCRIAVRFVLADDPGIQVGLLTPSGGYFPWLTTSEAGSGTVGVRLYETDAASKAAGEQPDAQNEEKDGSLDRVIALRPPRSKRERDAKYWIGQLRRLADSARISIYADCYADYRYGDDGHPRGGVRWAEQGTLRELLTTFCRAESTAAGALPPPHSFWWRRSQSIFVRSTRWIWQEQTIIPAAISEQIGRSLERNGRLSPDDLSALAALNRIQLAGAGPARGTTIGWTLGIEAASQFSVPGRDLLLRSFLVWERLLPADQAVLLRLFPGNGSAVPAYQASVETRLRKLASQGGLAATLIVEGRWNGNRGLTVAHLPLPGKGENGKTDPSLLECKLVPNAS